MPTQLATQSYSALLKKIRTEIEQTRGNIEHARALAYWKVGQYISEDILKNKARAGYGDALYQRLTRDLGVGERSLQRAVQFHREFPIPSPATELSWAHYTELLSVSDRFRRQELTDWAVKEGAGRNQLRAKILETRPSAQESKSAFSVQRLVSSASNPGRNNLYTKPYTLIPKKGPLNIYQKLSSSIVPIGKNEILLDLGFNVQIKVNRNAVPKGQIVTTRAKMSFTYRAYVEEVIDGDTLWVVIDLGSINVRLTEERQGRDERKSVHEDAPGAQRRGANIFTRQKLRLRGLDAPELGTAAGKQAKAFVVNALKGAESIIIRSSKSDKYDRYLADVFVPPLPQNDRKAANALRPTGAGVTTEEYIFLNQELLNANLAVGYKE